MTESNPFGLVVDERMLAYHLGSSHSMNTSRILPAFHLFQELFIDLTDTNFELIIPSGLEREYLLQAHEKEYVEAVERLSKKGEGMALQWGLGTPDCPVWKGMAETSEFIVSSSMQAAEKIYNDRTNYTFVLLGGLHHARAGKASGFCYYNDINVTIHKLKALSDDNTRILYVDTDLHHGDGTQFDFYHDPDVLTISLHESGQFLFPGTGFSNEIGSGEGKGASVNLPYHPFTWDDLYWDSLERYLPPIFESFNPEFVIWQSGVDGHRDDPLGHLMLTTHTYHKIGSLIRHLSEQMNTPRVLALGGGGYNPDSVARSWAHAVSGLSNTKLPSHASENYTQLMSLKGIEVSSELVDEKTKPLDSEHREVLVDATSKYVEEFERQLNPYFSF